MSDEKPKFNGMFGAILAPPPQFTVPPQLLERLADHKYQGALAALRDHHRVPMSFSAAEAWIWLGTVLADKYPPPKKRGPKVGKTRNKIDEKLIAVIEQVMNNSGKSFEVVLKSAIPLFIKRRVLPEAERTTHSKRLKRAYKIITEKRKRQTKILVQALMGHDFTKK